MNSQEKYATLGIDIGSTTVKIAILDEEHNILFSDYERHFANIRETTPRWATSRFGLCLALPTSCSAHWC